MALIGKSAPVIKHITHDQAGKANRIQAPLNTKTISGGSLAKVKTRTPEEMAKLKTASDTATDLGKVGTKAQINSLKARAKMVDLDGIDPPDDLSNLQIAKNVGKTIGIGIGKGLAAPFKATANYFSKDIKSGRETLSLADDVSKAAKDCGEKAEKYKGDAATLTKLGSAIKIELNREDTDPQRLSALLGEVSTLLAEDGLQGFGVGFKDLKTKIDTGQIDLTFPGKKLEVKSEASILDGLPAVLRTKSTMMAEKSKTLKKAATELNAEGGTTLTKGTTKILSKMSPLATATNFVGQSVYASQQGLGLMEVMAGEGGKVVAASTASVLAGAAGGLQIVSEGLELYNNVKELNSALTKVEMSKAVLADQGGRDKMVSDLEAKLDKLESPSKMKKFFSTKKGRASDIKNLQAKIAAIKKLPSADKVSAEAKLVAKQVVKRADIKFKVAKIAKNVLGIAAGAITIAVAVGALATPVGWVAAGVALSATIGLAVYSGVKSSSRNKKITNALKTQQNVGLKMDLKTQQAAKLKSQIKAITNSMGERLEKGISPKHITSESRLKAETILGQSVDADKNTIKGLEAQLSKIEGDISELKSINTETVKQLIATSPKHAAQAIYDGAKNGDESMKFLAERVLGVKSVGKLPEETALKLLSKKMNIKP